MKHQVVVIHGGDSYKSYKDYLNDLRNKKININRIRPSLDWKDTLQEDLGNNFDVLAPRFPNKQNAKYEEWKIMFNKILDITDKDLILIGHSLGAMFLIKYLSENKIDKNVKGLFLVAAPYKKIQEDDKLARFAFTRDLKSISKLSDYVYFIYSNNDAVVDLEDLEKFQSELPEANYLVFKDRSHFVTQNSLPEIIESIRGLV